MERDTESRTYYFLEELRRNKSKHKSESGCVMQLKHQSTIFFVEISEFDKLKWIRKRKSYATNEARSRNVLDNILSLFLLYFINKLN